MSSPGRDRAGGGVADRLLQAGRELLEVTELPTLLPGVRAVCKAAGVATSSFYWAFPDLEGYWIELLRSIADNDIVLSYVPETGALLDAAAAAVEEDPSALLEMVRQLAASNLEFHQGDGRAAFRLQLLLMGAGGAPPELAEAVRSEYRRLYGVIREIHDAAYARLLTAAGRTPREPFTIGSISIAITALADGLLLRGLLEDGTDVVTVFEDAVTALLAIATTGPGGEADLGAILARTLATGAPEPPA